MLSRRQVLKLGGAAAISAAMPVTAFGAADPDYSLDIATYSLQISPKHAVKTLAYNQQVPGHSCASKKGSQSRSM